MLPIIVRIIQRTFGRLLDLPIRRREEADAIRHAREPEKAGAFGESPSVRVSGSARDQLSRDLKFFSRKRIRRGVLI